MQIEKLLEILDIDFFTGVPDSLLSPLTNWLAFHADTTQNIVAANEGNATAIAAGYHLATGKIPLVYLQNSGIGNIVNPATSLLHPSIYGIPCVFLVGHRGKPGFTDEPQHLYQGKTTLEFLHLLGFETILLNKDLSEKEFANQWNSLLPILQQGKSIAIVVENGSLTNDTKCIYENSFSMVREEVIDHVLKVAANDPIICTTGKSGRELFELREKEAETHEKDFLTIGSMGHCSSIALGIALQKPTKKIWCIDGDGAAIMHMGAMAVIGQYHPNNFVHIVLNNQAHESVGGCPTAAKSVNLIGVATACQYENVFSVKDTTDLISVLQKAKKANGLTFIEIKIAIGSRNNLGRPTIAPSDNKRDFETFLRL